MSDNFIKQVNLESFDDDMLDGLIDNYENESENESENGEVAFEESKDYKEYSVQQRINTRQIDMSGETIEDILGLEKIDDKNKLYFNSIECYDVDLDIYEDILENSNLMQETLNDGTELLDSFKYLHQDIFLSLIKYKPILREEFKMQSSVLLNRKILNKLINTPEYISLRRNCQLDEFNSALGAEIIGQEAIELLKTIRDNMTQEEADKLNQLVETEELQEQLIRTNEIIEQMKQKAEQAGNTGLQQQLQEQLVKSNNSLQQAKAVANALASEVKETTERLIKTKQVNDQIKKVSNSFTKAEKEIKSSSEIAYEWGLGGGDSNLRINVADKKEAIETIRRSEKLRELTDIIGSFKDTAMSIQKKKSKYGAVEIKSVTTGKRIEDVLPSDRMNLALEETKKDFYRRMTENQLLVYKKESNLEKNKGPIVMCIDTSGSMSGNDEIWSKALAIAVLEIAQKQKRDFACVLFSSDVEGTYIIEKNHPDPKKVIEIAENFSGGGTNFEKPLKESLKIIEDSKFKHADILFITDGSCSISDSFTKKFRQTKESKDFKCVGVLVGSHYDGKKTSLDDFCDQITCIDNIRALKADSDINKAIFEYL